MIKEFNNKGHHFKVIPIENNPEEFIIIKDGRKTKRVKRDIAANAVDHVDELFKQ